MVKLPRTLAIIPARSGSQSLPAKNIKPIDGHPLLAFSVQAALDAQHVNEVIVSTDDDDFAEIARNYGATTQWVLPWH